MRWELSEDQETFQESFRGWLDRFAPSDSVRKWHDTCDPSAFEKSFVDEGWFSVGLPEDIGGQGGGLLELALAAQELGRRAAPASAWTATVLAAPLLPTEQARAALADGEFAALAVNAGAPVDVSPTVRYSGNGTIDGGVDMVLGGDRATQLVVPAVGASGIRLFHVPVDAPGVVRSPVRLLDRSRSAANMVFDGVAGTPIEGDAAAMVASASPRSAVIVSAGALGAMEKLLELAVRYSREREQFGVPIGSFQAMKHAAATILVEVEAARSIVYYAAASVDAGLDEAPLHAAAAKAQVTGGGVKVADSALTMHGAIGYTWEHDLHYFYKRLKLDQELWGAPSVWNERIAQLLPLVPAGTDR